jgi:hypothetical protein
MELEKILRKIQRTKFWQEKKNLIFLIYSLLMILLDLFFIFFKLRKAERFIPLHYNPIFGVDLIEKATKLLFFPFYALIIFLINFYFLFRTYEKEEKFLYNLLIIGNFFLQLFLFIGLIYIINL